MGHWAVEHLMGTIARTEFARKVWWFASFFLLAYGVLGVLLWSQSYNIYTYLTWALTVFSVGLLLTTSREHPLGGWLTLLSVPIIGFAVGSNGMTLLRECLLAVCTTPNGSSRLADNLAGAIDLATSVIFLGSFCGFVFFYRTGDRRELRFWTFLNPFLAALALPCIVAVSVITQWQYLNLRPWFAVVYPAAFIARGPDQLKQLAKRLRV